MAGADVPRRGLGGAGGVAGGGSRPAYYLLDGLDPGISQSTWTNATDAERFFAGSNVNVDSSRVVAQGDFNSGITLYSSNALINGSVISNLVSW